MCLVVTAIAGNLGTPGLLHSLSVLFFILQNDSNAWRLIKPKSSLSHDSTNRFDKGFGCFGILAMVSKAQGSEARGALNLVHLA